MVTVPAPDQCPDKPRNGLSEPGSAWACAEMSTSPDASTAVLRQLAEGFKEKKTMTFAFQFPSARSQCAAVRTACGSVHALVELMRVIFISVLTSFLTGFSLHF